MPRKVQYVLDGPWTGVTNCDASSPDDGCRLKDPKPQNKTIPSGQLM